MVNFPYPNGSIDSIIDLMLYNNLVTDGMYGFVTLIGFFFIALLSLKTFETGKALVGASFLTGILGFFFFVMGVLPGKYIWLPIAILAGSVVYLVFNK